MSKNLSHVAKCFTCGGRTDVPGSLANDCEGTLVAIDASGAPLPKWEAAQTAYERKRALQFCEVNGIRLSNQPPKEAP